MALVLTPPAAPPAGPAAAAPDARAAAERAPAWRPTALAPSAWRDPSALAAAIKASRSGVLVLRGAAGPAGAPFGAIQALFDKVAAEPALGARANRAYKGEAAAESEHMRLVYKDAHSEGRGGPHVDEKRVIDLSPHRMEQLSRIDAGLASELGAPLTDALSFFDAAVATAAPVVISALREATGCEAYSLDEARFAYRLVDYPERAAPAGGERAPAAAPPPRCGAHRDFGTATLIWRDGPGLEVRTGDAWHPLPAQGPGDAILLFGLCTAWRSNDRVRAAEHRVAAQGADPAPRRLSAVLFMGLCDAAPLVPALASAAERPRYKPATAGGVHPVVRRKWSWREGSVTAAEKAAEEAERAAYPTQEALIAALYKIA